MTEMRNNKGLGDIDLMDLSRKGFTDAEISSAISWLYDSRHIPDGMKARPGEPVRGSRRVLHEAEKEALATESQGYLIQLTELGLLNGNELETVIERVMGSGFAKVSVEELRGVVASVLFARGGEEGSNRLMLGSGDLIN